MNVLGRIFLKFSERHKHRVLFVRCKRNYILNKQNTISNSFYKSCTLIFFGNTIKGNWKKKL